MEIFSQLAVSDNSLFFAAVRLQSNMWFVCKFAHGQFLQVYQHTLIKRFSAVIYSFSMLIVTTMLKRYILNCTQPPPPPPPTHRDVTHVIHDWAISDMARKQKQNTEMLLQAADNKRMIHLTRWQQSSSQQRT